MTEMREKFARAKMVALRCSSLAAKTPIAGEPDPDWWERQSALGDACDKIHELLALYAPVMEENERLRDAVEPLALLAGGVNMNDPLRKWFTVAQLHDARAALSPKSDG